MRARCVWEPNTRADRMLGLVGVVMLVLLAADSPAATLPDDLSAAQLHLATASSSQQQQQPTQLFRLNGSAAPHHVFTSGATTAGDQPLCWDCSGCRRGDRLFSVPGCQPANTNQHWATVSIAGSSWVAIGPSSSSGVLSALCVTAHADGRAELLLQTCNASEHGQHWSALAATTAGAAIISRLFPDRRIDAKPIDFSGVEGGFLLWPRPQLVEVSAKAKALRVAGRDAFRFSTDVSSGDDTILGRALRRYTSIIFPTTTTTTSSSSGGGGNGSSSSGGCLRSLVVRCTGSAGACQDNATLGEDMQEGYELSVLPGPPAPTATLLAPSIWGLLRGLETWSQMVERTNGSNSSSSNSSSSSSALVVRAAPVHVRDHPRWGYRGLLVDTARHFMPLSLLRRHLDAMAASKLNVLHWHHHVSEPFQTSIHVCIIWAFTAVEDLDLPHFTMFRTRGCGLSSPLPSPSSSKQPHHRGGNTRTPKSVRS
eukprot:COSAG01_NODE_7183_length_3315_cov_13.824316_2_plen_483_part_00